MKRLPLALILAVSLLLVGAVAQVTREEFGALATQVRILRSDVALVKVRVRQLRTHVRTLEQTQKEVALPAPTAREPDVGRTIPRPAPTVRSGETSKPPWTGCVTCINRGDCDWCPFVLNRRATPLGADHVWLLEPDGQRPGLLTQFAAPPNSECPYGVTFDAALNVRLARLKDNLRRGVTTPAEAYETAVMMGMIEDGDPAPWDDESRLELADDRRRQVTVRCGGACGGLCFGCPVLG